MTSHFPLHRFLRNSYLHMAIVQEASAMWPDYAFDTGMGYLNVYAKDGSLATKIALPYTIEKSFDEEMEAFFTKIALVCG